MRGSLNSPCVATGAPRERIKTIAGSSDLQPPRPGSRAPSCHTIARDPGTGTGGHRGSPRDSGLLQPPAAQPALPGDRHRPGTGTREGVAGAGLGGSRAAPARYNCGEQRETPHRSPRPPLPGDPGREGGTWVRCGHGEQQPAPSPLGPPGPAGPGSDAQLPVTPPGDRKSVV